MDHTDGIYHMKSDCVEIHAELEPEQRATLQDLPARFAGPAKWPHGHPVEVQGDADEHGRVPVIEKVRPYNSLGVSWIHWSLIEDGEELKPAAKPVAKKKTVAKKKSAAKPKT